MIINNWADLKKFIDQLSDEQLQDPVKLLNIDTEVVHEVDFACIKGERETFEPPDNSVRNGHPFMSSLS